MRTPIKPSDATTRMTMIEDDGSVVSFGVIWHCRCRHDLRSHKARHGKCNHCRCETFHAAGYHEAYLSELDDLPNARLVAPDAHLMAQVFARIETMGACRGWESELAYLLVTVTHLDGDRLITSVSVAFAAHLTQLEPPEPEQEAVAAAILGPSPLIFGGAGHRGRELFGVDVDGRRYHIRRCRCCGSWGRECLTPTELSRRNPTDAIRSPRAAGLARQLAILLPQDATLEQGAPLAPPVTIAGQ